MGTLRANFIASHTNNHLFQILFPKSFGARFFHSSKSFTSKTKHLQDLGKIKIVFHFLKLLLLVDN